jgi:4-aminobutyrate aminotransferase / (S)-3-amino-2-methylpropionate transaminase / 5-aminovalerate transaminase
LSADSLGPKSRDLTKRRARSVPRGLATTTSMYAERAFGATITDVDGNEYIDFASGISVMNVGHGHPRVVAAMKEQIDRLVHPAAQVMMPELYIRLAERLGEITPGSHDKKTLLLNSGAEAVENAVKIARAYTGRPAVVSFDNAFHGRTLLAMTLTGKVAYKRGFGPYAPEVYHAPYPYPYRWPGDPKACGVESLEALQELFSTTIAAEQVAAVIVEPVQGEGGFIVPPPDFLPALAALCKREGIVFILDEVQTGFGRTGRLFAAEHWNLEPDLMLLAKSLGGGMPISAVVGRSEIMDGPAPGGLGGTFAGNALACAAALAVIEIMADENLPQRAQQIGEIAEARMRRWAQEFDFIGEVRGLGAMLAMELVLDRGSRAPDGARTNDIIHHCHDEGLVVLKAGLYDNVIRLLTPLIISDLELDRGLDILEESLRAHNTMGGTAA